jgi:hypothetical protein
LGDFAGGLPDVAEAVGFVDDDEVPGDLFEVCGAGGREVIGADGNMVRLPEARSFAFKDNGREGEFFGEFLLPLLAEGSGEDEEDFTAPFGPALRDDDTSFDRFAKPYFVGEEDAFCEGGANREEGGIDLVGVEVNARVGDGAGQGFDGSGGSSKGQGGGPVF